MRVCCCILAGTMACRRCSNGSFGDGPAPLTQRYSKSYTYTASNPIQKTVESLYYQYLVELEGIVRKALAAYPDIDPKTVTIEYQEGRPFRITSGEKILYNFKEEHSMNNCLDCKYCKEYCMIFGELVEANDSCFMYTEKKYDGRG